MRQVMIDYMDANQPCSALQVSEALGITRTSFYELHKKGQMHIVEYTRNAEGQAVALFVMGKGRDCKKPETMTQAERGSAYWHRHKAMIRARRPTKTQTTLGMWAGLL